MANWYGQSRSNYFRVQDEGAFAAWAQALSLEVWRDGEGRFALGNDSDGEWPSERWSEDDEEGAAFYFAEELQRHLAPGEVAILMTTGAQKLHYLTGFAVALHADGRQLRVDIDDIYALVLKEFGVEPSSATY